MKKIFTFCNLTFKKRLLGLLFLLLLCNNAFSQSVCRPVSQTNSQGGLLCVGLNVDSPANAYDNDAGLTTFATLTNAVGVGCFVEETLTFSQTARAGDQVVIYFGTGNGLLDVSLLSNASIQTKLSGTNVGARTSLNNPLLNLNLLNGNGVGVARYTFTGDGNQIQIQVGGLLSLLVNLRIYDVRLDFAKPTVTGGLNQTVCSGNSANLTAAPVAGTTLAWYDSATSTTPLITGNTFNTPTLTANTTYFIGVTRAAGCEASERLPVVVNVSNPIAPVINISGTTICSAGATQQTTLSVLNPIPGTTYSWFSSSSGGLALASGTTYSPTVPVGTTNFYVEASIGTCLSPARTPVSVISNAIPTAPTVLTQSVTIQSGQNATLSATTAQPGDTLNWYDVPAGGTAVALNTTTFTTPILTATKIYYVEAQSASGGCVSTSRVPVTVTVVGATLGGCLEASSQQTAINGLCLLCTSTNPNNSVDGNPATAARLTLPVGLLNAYIQQILQFTNPGKAGDIVDVELELPGGLADVALLGGVSLATYNGATFNNDRVFINNPLVTLQLLTGNRFRASVVAGANFDRVEIRFGAVVTVLTNLDIYQATYRYQAPAITGNTTICSGTATTLTADLAVGETVNWYNTATGGTPLVSTAAYTTPTLTVPTTYYVEITRNGCVNSERTTVNILINNPVAPSVGAVPTTICAGQTSTITVQAPVAGTIYNWYDAATAGNLLFTGTSFTTPALSTNTSYFVEAVIGDCISAARTTVSVNVDPLPTAPTAVSSTVIIQSGQNVTLQVNPVAGVNNDWYDVPTGGTSLAVNTDTFTPTPALTANKTYYVQARSTASNCLSTARTAINVVVINTVSSCLQPNSQAVALDPGLLCVGCSSNNDTNAIDGNINTASTLTIPVGVAGTYIQQQLIFPNPGQAGDIIDVELEIPSGLNISALSYLGLATYNGVTFNNDRIFVNNNLLDIQLLSGNRFKASFTTAATFDRIEVRLGTDVLALGSSVNIYEASYRFPDAVITGNATPICAGGTATLSATTSGTETFAWYDSPTGGAVVAVNPTLPLASTTTFYLEATRGGTCVNSIRQLVTVNVNPFSTAADINVTTPIEASCGGVAVLAPTSTLAGAQFRYYTDQNKTQEIITGAIIAGVTYTKDPTTGALSASGLTAGGAPYNYFISVTSPTTCENEINTLQPVSVTIPSQTSLAVTSPLLACGSADLTTAITAFDTTGNTTYTFYDASNNVINPAAATNITTSGVYSIQAQGNGVTCPSVILPVTVTINPLPSLSVDPSISVNAGTNVVLNATSDGTLAWFDPQGNAITGPPFTTGILNTPGIYTYTVVASNANCSRTGTISINVIDPASCQDLTQRVYANAQTSGSIVTGAVSDGANAVDENPQTFSTITTGVGLLGIGTTWQNLTWPANIVKGTPVTIKLGSEYSAVALGQNLSVIGTKSGVDIGTMQPVSNSLLNLLSGDNAFEFSFVPSDGTGPQDYDGIRIQSASILSVAQNTKVFDAYYTRSVPTVACTPGDIQDIYYGATDLGIGALTATVGVSDAWNVADNDITTFATMYSGAGVLASADLTVAFKTPSIASDTLRIVVSKPAILLDVSALTGFSIQRYLGNVAVGTPIQNTSTLLSIRLLPGNTMSMVLVNSQPEPYDRVRIRFGGVTGVLEFLRVHTVERVANTQVVGGDPNNKVIVCPGTDVTLQIPEEACSTYVWYDAATGGNVVANGITYTVPATLASGIYKYYVQPVRYGCESFARGEVVVEVRASSVVNALTDITLNGGATTSICSPTGTVTLATSLNGTPVLTNPVYYWYSFDGTTSQLIAGQNAPQLVVNSLTPGTYTYYVGVSSDEFCQTAAADRKQITFTILPPSTATDISVNDVAVCHDVPALLTPSAVTLTNPIFTWYLDANKTQPITNGVVISGVTYTISTTGVLTVTGLTRALSPVTYYVGVSSATTCENIAGTLQSANIIINDPNTPTTTDNTQDFCLIDVPTFANIQVNETNVIWYNVATGGTAFASTAALTSGIYFGAILDPITSCESSVRLQVTISVTDPGTPTTTDTTQDFCLVDAPTFASIQVNETNVVWYNLAIGGTAFVSTAALTSGTYYGAIIDPVTNCASNTRLAVTISVTDPGTPTTTDTTQDFCLVDAPTFASIQVNETNVVWYNLAIGGTAFASTATLTSGTYYGAIVDPVTTCASNTRLAVTISVTDPGTPTTTDTTQDFCLIDTPTFASIQVNEANVIWYNASTGGTAFTSTAVLTSGTYYGAIVNPVTNCESNTRLTVIISVTDPGTPTTTDTTQDFCLVNAPTFASIQVNETNVIWYNLAIGGTAFASTATLTSGTYYGAIVDPVTNCASNTRLAVTINVTDPGTPTTTDTTQDFCLVDAPTFASIQVNETNVVWYNLAIGGTAFASTATLTSGTYYGAIVDPVTNCASNTRLAVTINVTDPGTPTTTDTTQDFCLVDAPTFASIQVNETNVVWYNLAIGGTAFASTATLTRGTYYGAIIDPVTNCASNTRLAVTISVTDPGTPTTTDTTQDFCLIDAPIFASIQVNETNVVWYNVATGGTAFASTAALTSGTYYGAIVNPVTNCESNTRLAVTISVTDPGTPTTTDTTQDFCLIDAPTFASIQVNELNVVWYNLATGGTAFASTAVLTSGTYYGAIVNPVTNCESNTRLAVTITVTDPGTPTTTDTTQDFCLVDAPTFASIQVNELNVVWYNLATGGTAFASTAALTGGIYYGAIIDPVTNCASNTRLAVTISVTDPGTPTTTDTTQDFCLVDAPTFASIQVNETNVVWYNLAIGGTAFASTATLTSGIYYGAIIDPVTNCASNTRLAVTISVTDPGAPTSTDTTQDFCLIDTPTFASIQVNEPNVVWYNAATGGTAFALTAALTSGNYYGAISDPVTNCESSVRLLVTISVTDPGTPTTTDTTQDFCLIDTPTFASIQVNEPNVVWYNAATGGTALASTAALTSGTYYGAISDPVTNCESSVRLLVTISVTDPGTPTTTDTTQDFCLVNAPTFASIQVNEANVVWYNVATGGTAFASTAVLTSGTYYGAIIDPLTTCASNTRLAVTISVTDPGTPTTTDTTQDFCLIDTPTFASIQVNEANVVWYNAATGGTAFTLTAALTSGTYYGAIVDPITTCASNTRLAVTISVTDPGAPTSTDTTQDFCLIDTPTFASIQVNEPNVVWYNAATGGTAFASTAALTSGTYYGAIVDPVTTCASNTRLAVTISVTDPGTPTTTDTSQDFCLVNGPTFANIQVNEPNVVWYNLATGGTAFASTAALTSGTYYGAISDPVTNCESSVRLLVTISITDPGTPTTTDTTQDFCLVNAPTFASIQVNQTNVVWYNAATGGTALASTAALTSGTYYGAISDPVTTCASNTRLLVTINVTDPGTPTTTDTTQDFCLIDAPTFASIQVNEANVVWYNAAKGGTALALTAALTSRTYYGAIIDPVTNCASNTRLAITISVTDPGTPTTTDTTQDFCLIDAPTFASIQVNEANVVWYNAAAGGTAFALTAALTSGTYYGAIIDPVTNCASNTRLAIIISVTDPGAPTTTDTTQDFCLVNAPTFASIQVNEPNVVWYNAATGGTALASTAALTSGTYYGAIVDQVTNCASNTRLAVTISVTDPGTPTTTDTTQDFCSVNAPTFASIQINEANVVWYNAATGGTAFASTSPLTNGTYYGAVVNPSGNCESVTRLQVTVTIGNPAATPTTADITQNLCSLNSPTVSNIQVNEANVIWYSAPTGGLAIPETTALTTNTYYGAIASSTGCENPVRLAVQVNVNTPGIITTPNTTQRFCLSAIPTIASILVNEPNVVWYSSATGGTPLAANTSLTATTYYASALGNTTNGCINATRLAITIEFENDALVQLTTSDNTPCVFQGVTYSIANGKSDYVWSVSNGTITSGGGNSDGSVTVSWSDVGPGTVTVTYTNNCDETTTKTLNVTVATCSDLTITNTVSNPAPNFGEEIVFTIKVNNVGEGLINNILVSELIPSGYTLVSSSTSSGVYDPATQVWTIPTLPAGTSETLEVRLLVLPSGNYNNVATIEISTPLDVDATNNSATAVVEPICLTVYNEFTPNNDGANDLFRIDCIETHPNNELKVFNRYGALVYSKKNYENDWDGTANVSGVVNRGDMLPTGTYFYVIDTGDGTVKKGWLSIMR